MGWIKKNPRLTIEYLLIGVIIVIGVSVVNFRIRNAMLETRVAEGQTAIAETKSDLIAARQEIAVNTQTNKEQSTTIKTLTILRAIDGQAIDELVRDMKAAGQYDSTIRAKLKILENTNVAVKNFMDADIPPELGCVRDGGCETTTAIGDSKN